MLNLPSSYKDSIVIFYLILDNQINELYRGANFLQMNKLARCICAAVACRIYHNPTLQGYKDKKKELKIDQDMDANFSKKMKEDYVFMN